MVNENLNIFAIINKIQQANNQFGVEFYSDQFVAVQSWEEFENYIFFHQVKDKSVDYMFSKQNQSF